MSSLIPYDESVNEGLRGVEIVPQESSINEGNVVVDNIRSAGQKELNI